MFLRKSSSLWGWVDLHDTEYLEGSYRIQVLHMIVRYTSDGDQTWIGNRYT